MQIVTEEYQEKSKRAPRRANYEGQKKAVT
jgi:hypothetical protein